MLTFCDKVFLFSMFILTFAGLACPGLAIYYYRWSQFSGQDRPLTLFIKSFTLEEWIAVLVGFSFAFILMILIIYFIRIVVVLEQPERADNDSEENWHRHRWNPSLVPNTMRDPVAFNHLPPNMVVLLSGDIVSERTFYEMMQASWISSRRETPAKRRRTSSEPSRFSTSPTV